MFVSDNEVRKRKLVVILLGGILLALLMAAMPAQSAVWQVVMGLTPTSAATAVVQVPTATATATASTTPTPTVTPTATATPTDTPTGLYGDATGGGEVDVADYAEVKAVILSAGSCNPGADATMDGCIDVSDYAQVKSLVLGAAIPNGMYVSGYDFSTGSGTAHVAAYKQVATMPADIFPNEAGWQPFNGGYYSDVEAIDADDFSMSANATGYNAVQCRFTVDGGINLSTVTDLGVTLAGSSENTSETLQFWAWNFDTSSWQQVDGDIPMSIGEDTYTKHTVCDCWGRVYESYINGSGYMYILFLLDTPNRDLNVDYVRAELTYP